MGSLVRRTARRPNYICAAPRISPGGTSPNSCPYLATEQKTPVSNPTMKQPSSPEDRYSALLRRSPKLKTEAERLRRVRSEHSRRGSERAIRASLNRDWAEAGNRP